MTYANFAALVRYYTRTNASTFTDADMLILANIFKDEIAERIGKDVGEDYFGLRLERDLLAGVREYQLPSELMGRIKFLQAKLDGTEWKMLKETDLTDDKLPIEENEITEYYADKDPEFDIWDQGINLLTGQTIIDVTNGLKLWAIIYPANFTSLTSTDDMSTNPDEYSHGFPKPFQELLARRVSIAYKTSEDRPIPLSEKEQLYEADFKDAIDNMKGMNLDRTFIPTVPDYDGNDY
jgi:hypothetical protein